MINYWQNVRIRYIILELLNNKTLLKKFKGIMNDITIEISVIMSYLMPKKYETNQLKVS